MVKVGKGSGGKLKRTVQVADARVLHPWQNLKLFKLLPAEVLVLLGVVQLMKQSVDELMHLTECVKMLGEPQPYPYIVSTGLKVVTTVVANLAVEGNDDLALEVEERVQQLAQGWHAEFGALCVPYLNKFDHTGIGAARRGRLP